MGRISPVRRINKEDFSQEDQQLIERLSTLLNASLEEITNAINGNIQVGVNTNESINTVDVEVTSTGVPKVDTNFKVTLKSRCRGLEVVRAEDMTGTGTFVNSAPFVSFTEPSTGVISVKHVTGLPADKKYRLTIRAFG